MKVTIRIPKGKHTELWPEFGIDAIVLFVVVAALVLSAVRWLR